MKAVVALGGNALSRRGEPFDADLQRRRVGNAAGLLAGLSEGNDLVLTHGNGPQVGVLAVESESSPGGRRPLDVLGAETEGMIGYWIEQEMGNRLPGRQVVTLLTQVEVAADDPAFRSPTKPIGPVFSEEAGRGLADALGWTLAPEPGGLRRVVPSPEPRAILELAAVQILLRAGVVVVCAGGGGIPVVRGDDGSVRGVEAVVDKDLSAALLAGSLDAEVLVLLTDVPAVFTDWPDTRRPLRTVTPPELRTYAFAPGSMGPKVEAACRFVERGGGRAAIGRLEDAAAVLDGRAGTQVS